MASELNTDHISWMAAKAVSEISERGFVRIGLTPGDGTIYDIIVIGPGPRFEMGGPNARSEMQVTLANIDGGSSYPWAQMYMTSDYCAEKWGHGRPQTGRVMAAFLNAILAHSEADSDG